MAASWASFSFVWPDEVTSSPIDPDTSMTKRTCARLRSSSQDFCTSASTAGEGGEMMLAGPAGSIPLAWEMAAPGSPSKVRKPASVKVFCCSGSCSHPRKSVAA